MCARRSPIALAQLRHQSRKHSGIRHDFSLPLWCTTSSMAGSREPCVLSLAGGTQGGEEIARRGPQRQPWVPHASSTDAYLNIAARAASYLEMQESARQRDAWLVGRLVAGAERLLPAARPAPTMGEMDEAARSVMRAEGKRRRKREKRREERQQRASEQDRQRRRRANSEPRESKRRRRRFVSAAASRRSASRRSRRSCTRSRSQDSMSPAPCSERRPSATPSMPIASTPHQTRPLI